MRNDRQYGLIGKSLKHSFSADYFNKKFSSSGLDHQYHNFEISQIEDFTGIVSNQRSISGLNVTFPYKESIIPYLDSLSETAEKIGAVNTIEFIDGRMIGHNTDSPAFAETLKSYVDLDPSSQILILGSGGASKAIEYAIKSMGYPYTIASRKSRSENKFIDYKVLEELGLESFQLIVNCTPLGTFPNLDSKPGIPYDQLTKKQYLYDLIYNPELSSFLKEGQKRGVKIKNGKEMLIKQAELSWSIWNQKE